MRLKKTQNEEISDFKFIHFVIAIQIKQFSADGLNETNKISNKT